MNQSTTRNTVSIGIVVTLLIVGGIWWMRARETSPFSDNQEAMPPPSTPTAMPSKAPYIWGVFSGTLPCADCEGINTILTLTSEGQHIDTGLFTLSQQYLGKAEQPLVSKGNWTINRGTPEDMNASVVSLAFDDGSDMQYFLRIKEDELRLLDVNQRNIQSTMNYSLLRQTGPEVPMSEERDDKQATTKTQLIGVWQDQSDPHYHTEFKEDGTQLDSYTGETKTTTTGTWMLFTANSNEPTSFQLNNNDVYMKQTTSSAIVYFRISELTPTTLTLVAMDKGSVLSFKRIQ